MNISDLFGSDYKQKTVDALNNERIRKGRLIHRSLRPFAKADTFPATFNPRGVHALFALCFLYYSDHLIDLIHLVKGRTSPRISKELNSQIFTEYMLETIEYYEHVTQFKDSTVRLYGDMSDSFHMLHLMRGLPSCVEDQLVVVIDFANPVDQISSEIVKLVTELKQTVDSTMLDQLQSLHREPVSPFFQKLLFSKQGAPLIGDTGEVSRSPKTYLPEWYEALMILRMRRIGHGERTIISRLYGKDKSDPGYAGKKTIVYNRKKLAERLIFAAYHRAPLTAFHRGDR